MIEILHRLIPPSRERIRKVNEIVADAVLESLVNQGISFEMKLFGEVDWDVTASYLSDEEILPLLRMQDAHHSGILEICTDACSFYRCDPFKCPTEDLEKFINEYNFGMFFDGDVVMIGDQSRTLTVYHHSGGYTHVKL